MDPSKFSHNISLAKSDNARWLTYANGLIQSRTVVKGSVAAYRDECIACQWLYDHGDEISALYKTENSEIDLFRFDIMEQIEVLRYDLHERYLQIFKLYNPDRNNTFFAFLFKKKRGVSDDDRRSAAQLYREMEQIVEELDAKLDHLEQSLEHLCRLNIA